jgi:hypothetical protein
MSRFHGWRVQASSAAYALGSSVELRGALFRTLDILDEPAQRDEQVVHGRGRYACAAGTLACSVRNRTHRACILWDGGSCPIEPTP